MEKKPFIFGVATSGDNFTDREKETSRLVLNFRHGVNTVRLVVGGKPLWCRKRVAWRSPTN